jgi:homoserine kinase
VGNAGVGFDVMGFALEKPGDEVVVRYSDNPGLTITKITGAEGKLPLDPLKNTAGFAALKLLEYLNEPKMGIQMEIHKKMPIGCGLGSSAASAVAGVFAVNELLKRPLEKKDLLAFALQGEYLASGGTHADNVAPSLMGGLLLIRDVNPPDVCRLPIPRGLYASVIYPHFEVLTKTARSILKDTVPLKGYIQQSANLGAFVVGLFNSDLELISRSLKDILIEPQRASLIPKFYEVKEAALHNGALGCSISGAGPSIFALSANSLLAEQVGEEMRRVYDIAKIKCDLFISPINQEGAIKL